MQESGQEIKVKDPVCGMQVSPDKTAASITHDGKTYSFCSHSCAEKFRANPAHYTATEIDPVCGMKVAPARAAAKLERDGKTYFFCGKGCAEKFQNVTGAEKTDGVAAALPNPACIVDYICPMDPEVHEQHPGPCPICGMALEPA